MQQEGWTRVSVRRTHLELRRPSELRPGRPSAEPVELRRRRPISAVEYLELYALVGELWLWRDRLIWTEAELERYLASPDVHVWSAHVRGATAGYFELRQHTDRSVEMMYFGLAPAFMGRGIGGWLLTRAAHEAFALGAPRIVLNPCTIDAPQALPNYLARGFTIVSEDQYLLDVPAKIGQALPTAMTRDTAPT
jgi:ribosomal protein S18 acetylase RimI-like enzyme